MKKYLNFLQAYIKEFYNWRLYVSTAFLLVILIYLEVVYNIRDVYISPYYGSYLQLIFYFLLQVVPYLLSCCLIYIFTDCKTFFKQTGFWVYTGFGFLVLAHYRSFFWDWELTKDLDPQIARYVYKSISKLVDVLLIVIPLGMFYAFWDKHIVSHFYGLQTKGVSWKVYGYFMLMMAGLVGLASFQSSFLEYYPTYKSVGGDAFSKSIGVSEGVSFALYEFCYAMKFISVEVFFRGFLVFSMLRFLKGYTILPMAVTYCVLHFGKPYGETVSSIFGGYLLGVFAYYSRNIYGGIAIHMGIAVVMDIAAYLQLYVWGEK